MRSKVVGSVRPAAGSIVSPFFGRPCVAYKLLIRTLSDRQEATHEEQDIGDFSLADDTGSFLVQTPHIELHLQTVAMCERSTTFLGDHDLLGEDELARLTVVLDRHDRSSMLEEADSVAVMEWYLLAHSRAAVAGVPVPGRPRRIAIGREADEQDPFRRLPPQAAPRVTHSLELGPGRHSPVLLSDDPTTFE